MAESSRRLTAPNSGLDVETAAKHYEKLYEHLPNAGACSREARRRRGLSAASLAFGETDFEALNELFATLKALGLAPGGEFVDLGSGSGPHEGDCREFGGAREI